MDSELLTHLNAARKLLAEITAGADAQHRAETETFMNCVFVIGQALELQPQLSDAEPVISFLKETEAQLDNLLYPVSRYVVQTTYILASSWEAEEWVKVCRRRSAIEFFRQLFAISETNEYLDTEEVDELTRTRGQDEGYLKESSIPEGIPPSHWWWWYPNSPPAAGQPPRTS
jgi:hypothetical protein